LPVVVEGESRCLRTVGVSVRVLARPPQSYRDMFGARVTLLLEEGGKEKKKRERRGLEKEKHH